MLEPIRSSTNVSYVNEEAVCLTAEFLVRLYESWLVAPFRDTILGIMVEESLDLDSLVPDASRYLELIFQRKGRPNHELPIFLSGRMPELKDTNSGMTKGSDEALLLSGKFVKRTRGIGLEESFEEELFSYYPGLSVEEALRKAGINPELVSRHRIRRMKEKFKARLSETHLQGEIQEQTQGDAQEQEGAHAYDEGQVSQYACHPYVLSITPERLTLRDAFFNDAASICSLPIDRVLDVFGFDPDLCSEGEKAAIRTRLSRWTPNDDAAPYVEGTTEKILASRWTALSEVCDSTWQGIGTKVPGLDPEEKQELFRSVAAFAKNCGSPGELSRILRLMGVSRSSFYGCLSNKDYGAAKRRKEAQDEEDAAIIRKVFEYKGFKKGVRLVKMMLPSIAGVSFGIKKVRRLMRKYGMDCGVRKPNPAKRRSKDYLSTHVKPNLLRRRFRLGRPNKYRLTDVTYLDYGKPSSDGKRQRAYGSAMIDSVTGKLVAMNVSTYNDEDLVLETLRLSREYEWIEGGMVHSDQGVLYLSDEFQDEVRRMGLEQSMSKRGNSQDNSPQESFFGHFKDETDYASCSSIEELRELVNRYTEYYNTERPMECRRGMTPVAYEEYLLSMDDEEFSYYLAGEEEKYARKKARARELAIARAKTLGVDGIKEDCE